MDNTAQYVCQLSESEKQYVATHLNENDEVRQRSIDEIRRWIVENENLHARTDDFSILKFLRACKFDIGRTKKKLNNFHKQRAMLPEWYANRNPFLPELQELFDMGVFLPLRELDEEGKMIIIVRTSVHDPNKHKQADVLKAGKMVLDIATRDNETVSIHGVTAIFDMDGVTLGHGLQMTPGIVKRLVHSWQSCYPLRIESMNFVNAPKYVNVVLNVFRCFMSKKMRTRLHVHTRSNTSFFDKIPSHILPEEYGGRGESIRSLTEYWKKIVTENTEWFAEDEKYKMILERS
ncbi:retinol-binding protein pinta [Venturia canescens]|uniref:retinol-binding protein pinta n=1 Tax=Venturia canescens TaxID=32260 RepID=UPI001C9BCC0C|nr:retinol-binding protein pinta [Venturia canescens]